MSMRNMELDNKLRVSVIIPTYIRKDELKKCLESLFKQNYPKNLYEIIIIDGGTTDGTEGMISEIEKEAPCPIRYFKQGNMGVAAARNIGIKNSNEKYTAFIDSDCIARENWLEKLMETISSTGNDIGGVGGKILNGIDTWIGNGGYLNEFYGYLSNETKFTRVLPTANLCLEKDILNEVGYFDENLRTSEDTDICWRIIKRGYKILYTPDIIVTHYGVKTLKELWKKQISLGRGFMMTRKKHGDLPPIKIPKNIVLFVLMLPLLYIASLIRILSIDSIKVLGFKVVFVLPIILFGRMGYWIGALREFKEKYSEG